LLRDLLEEMMEYKSTRGERRIGMIGVLREGNSYDSLKRRALDLSRLKILTWGLIHEENVQQFLF